MLLQRYAGSKLLLLLHHRLILSHLMLLLLLSGGGQVCQHEVRIGGKVQEMGIRVGGGKRGGGVLLLLLVGSGSACQALVYQVLVAGIHRA